ncbi:MAG: hypothetical protein ACPGOV_16325 [Magnetovibrionaceae bacterium]
MIARITFAVALIALLVPPLPAAAQYDDAPLVDWREELRVFVQRLGDYARGLNPQFVVLGRDGLDLLEKFEDGDETRRAPARAYIQSLDGIIVNGLWAGRRQFGQADIADVVRIRREKVDLAAESGLRVLTWDATEDPILMGQIYLDSEAEGFVPFVSDSRFGNRLPAFPPKPPGENPNNVLALEQVRNYLMLDDSTAFGTQAQYAFAMHDLNHDMLVVDVMHGRQPLQRGAIERMKYKKIGARRLVLAKLNLTIASRSMYYWQIDWREGSPYWIAAPVPGDPDSYRIEYWRPEWQATIFGNATSFVYGLWTLGFDGVVLEGLDTFRYFEGTEDEERDDDGLEVEGR